MLAEVSETGLAVLITAVGGAIFGLYSLLRKTQREQNSADADAARKTDSDNADYWRRQYEIRCEADDKFKAKLVAQMDDLYAKHRESEKEHLACREEHAQARGELTALRRDLASKETRIAELERLLGGRQ